MLSATIKSRLVDASTGTARTGRSQLWSYTPSTSITSRLSGGRLRACAREFQNVLGCVLIAVMGCAALAASEGANVQRHSFVNVPTSRASFAAGEEPIRNANLFPVPRSLVLQHRPEHSEAGTRNVLGEAVIPHHSAYVQVFNRQNVEPANQISRQLVQTVFTTVGDVDLMPSNLQLLPMPSTASFDTAGKYPLQSSQLASVPHRVSRVGDPSPIGQGCQPRDSKIDPDLLARLGECELRWFIQTKAHEISPTSVLGYRDRGGRTRKISTPFDVETTELSDEKPIVFGIPFESPDSIFGALPAVLGSEPWILRPLGEEVTKSRLQMPQSLLLRDAGALSKKRECWIVPMLS